jgi:hypothetical protein
MAFFAVQSNRQQEEHTGVTLEDVAEEVMNGLFCHYEPPTSDNALRKAAEQVRANPSGFSTEPLPMQRKRSKSILKPSRLLRRSRKHSRTVTWRDQGKTVAIPTVMEEKVASCAINASHCDFLRRSTAEDEPEPKNTLTENLEQNNKAAPTKTQEQDPIEKFREKKSPKGANAPTTMPFNDNAPINTKPFNAPNTPKPFNAPNTPKPFNAPNTPKQSNVPPKKVLYDDEGNPILEDGSDENVPPPSPSLSVSGPSPVPGAAPQSFLLDTMCGMVGDIFGYTITKSTPEQKDMGANMDMDMDVDVEEPENYDKPPTANSLPFRRIRSPPVPRSRYPQDDMEDDFMEEEYYEAQGIERLRSRSKSPSRHRFSRPDEIRPDEIRPDEIRPDEIREYDEEEQRLRTPNRSPSRGKWFKRWRRPQTPHRDRSGEWDDEEDSDSRSESDDRERLGRPRRRSSASGGRGRSRSPARGPPPPPPFTEHEYNDREGRPRRRSSASGGRGRSRSPASFRGPPPPPPPYAEDDNDSGVVNDGTRDRRPSSSRSPGRPRGRSSSVERRRHLAEGQIFAEEMERRPDNGVVDDGARGRRPSRGRSPGRLPAGRSRSAELRHHLAEGQVFAEEMERRPRSSSREYAVEERRRSTDLAVENRRRSREFVVEEPARRPPSSAREFAVEDRRRSRDFENRRASGGGRDHVDRGLSSLSSDKLRKHDELMAPEQEIEPRAPRAHHEWVDPISTAAIPANTSPKSQNKFVLTPEGWKKNDDFSRDFSKDDTSEKRRRSDIRGTPQHGEEPPRRNERFTPSEERRERYTDSRQEDDFDKRRVSDPTTASHRQRRQVDQDEQDNNYDQRRPQSTASHPERRTGAPPLPIETSYKEEEDVPLPKGHRDPTPRMMEEDLQARGLLPPTPRRDISPEQEEVKQTSFKRRESDDRGHEEGKERRMKRELLRQLSPVSMATDQEIREEASSVGMESSTIRPLYPNPFLSIPDPIRETGTEEATDNDPSTLTSHKEEKVHNRANQQIFYHGGPPPPSKTPPAKPRDTGSTGSKVLRGLRKRIGMVRKIAKDIDQHRLPSPGQMPTTPNKFASKE